MKNPHILAYMIIDQVLSDGMKTHPNDDWRNEPQDKHLDKAMRHILTHKLVRDGHQKPNGENHLHHALTRIAMAIAQEKK
ncbi:MAG TPA: dATP/dGTP diphosphohydrolase domain-containing protein [Gemmataceae bacterium]|nr:dATP/dGTP diphosphohydrolase domain-containing protein [Gemmataceae bacterium]